MSRGDSSMVTWVCPKCDYTADVFSGASEVSHNCRISMGKSVPMQKKSQTK